MVFLLDFEIPMPIPAYSAADAILHEVSCFASRTGQVCQASNPPLLHFVQYLGTGRRKAYQWLSSSSALLMASIR